MTAYPADDLVDAVAQAVRSVPGVHDLHPGPAGEVATYLPGRRVTGLRPRPDGWDVHVVVRSGHPLLATGDDVCRAVQAVSPGVVDVTVEDIAPAGEPS